MPVRNGVFLTYYIIVVSGFTIIPEDVTVTISASAGSTRVARFFCQPYAADNIFWLVNGTHPQDLPFPTGITTCSNALPNGTQGQRIYTLKIEARLEYNETTIVCAAVYFSRSTPVEFSNPEAQLIIFGKSS